MESKRKRKKTCGMQAFFIGLGLMLLLQAGCNTKRLSNPLERTITSAVYLQHVGESDKSILPVVISTDKPSETELKRMLGEVVWDEATLVSVTANDFHKIMTAVYKSLQASNDSKEEYSFGTFRVTIIEQESGEKRIIPANITQMTRILSRDEIIFLLLAIEEIEETSATRNNKLRITIASLKRRLT